MWCIVRFDGVSDLGFGVSDLDRDHTLVHVRVRVRVNYSVLRCDECLAIFLRFLPQLAFLFLRPVIWGDQSRMHGRRN